MNERILVWDLPLRIFHWVLAASFAGAFLTADSERLRDLHVLCGATFAGAIAFRLVWGFVGTRNARFAALRFDPGAIVRSLRALVVGRAERPVGHGPIAAVMIPALLGLGIVVAASGWAVHADFGGEWLEETHEVAAGALLGLVALHVLGVVATSLAQRENLMLALVTGRKTGRRTEGIRSARPFVAILLLGALVAFWLPALSAREDRAAGRAGHRIEATQHASHDHGD